MTDNFIQDLTAQEKTTFVRALLFLIKADGHVDERERALIHEIVNIYGFKEDMKALGSPMTEEIILSEIGANVRERSKALLLLRELLIMAHIDDKLEDKELDFVEKTAKILNIEEEKVLAVNDLVLDRKLWLLKSAKVMEEA